MKCQSFPFFAAVFALTFAWGVSSLHAADEAALDTATIQVITGLKGVSNQKEGTFKVSKPRDDVSVTVEQSHMAPFMFISCISAVKALVRAIFDMEKEIRSKLQYQPTPSVWDRCPLKVSLTGMRLVEFSGKQAMPKTACTK
jgi:hypothetical protein